MKNMNNRKLPTGALSLQLNIWGRICVLFIALLAMCFLFASSAYADIASGTCGTCQWVIDDSGKLTIESGTLESYSNTRLPAWYNYADNITSVVVNSGVSTSSGCNNLFSGLRNCTSMSLSNLNTSNATTMDRMFYNCRSLSSLDVSGFDTSKVTTMSSMFSNCRSITSLNVRGFNTLNVISMRYMFQECQNLISLDVSEFNTGNVTDMSYMFSNCRSLTSLDLSGFDTSKVTTMDCMFLSCKSLTSLDIGGFNTRKVTTMMAMFNGCSNLTSLDVSGFYTGNVTRFDNMFYGCSSLTSLDLIGFDTGKATNMRVMFSDCSSLSTVILGDQFRFDGCGISTDSDKAVLPTPPTTTPYTGKWIKQDRTAGPLVPTELRDQYAANAGEWSGTWIWENAVLPTYRIEFSIPSGVLGSMTSQDVETSQDYALEKQHLYKFGYSFNYWRVDGNATTYQDQATIPANTYTAGTTVTLIPVFEAIDTTLNMVNGEIDLYLYGNEKATFADLPAGTAYEVWEETPSGWRLVYQSNVSGTIEPLQTSTASFVNEYAPGTVTATICGSKILDGKAAPAGAYQFQLLENGSIIQTVYNQAGGFIAFDPITYTGAGTHTYTVREVNGGDSSIQYDSHTETITVSITQDGDGVLQASVTYDSDGINFVNTTRPGVLEIIKQAIGLTQANSNSTFTFNVILQNGDGTLSESGYAWHVENVA